MRYWVQLATEQFPPSALVRQAVAAERAGFDGMNVSDHYQPWWEPGESAHAWALLGAIGTATESAALGTGVTAPCSGTTRRPSRSSSRPSRRFRKNGRTYEAT
jgi:coenzyme F420-dependent glucose-6-phosphate dehydrogenase